MLLKWLSRNSDLNDAFQVREAVFVNELGENIQNERNSSDFLCEHVVVYEGQYPVGTLKCVNVGTIVSIESLAVLKNYRNNKLGSTLVHEAVNRVFRSGVKKIFVKVDDKTKGFFMKIGFVKDEVSDESSMKNLKTGEVLLVAKKK